MRIAVVSDVIYPWVKGGAERRYYELYRRLSKNHEVHYFTMRYPNMQREFKYQGMTIHAICNAPNDLYTGVQHRRRICPAITFTICLIFELFKYNFDAIDCNEFPHIPLFAVKLICLFRRKTVFASTWHEFWSLSYWQSYLGRFRGLIGFSIQLMAARIPDVIIAVSNHTANIMKSQSKIQDDAITVVWNGVDHENIARANSIADIQQNKIIFVGRLISEKRVDLLIKITKYFRQFNPDIKLTIIGDGPEREFLERLAIDIDVEFLGFMANHLDVLVEIASSTVFISMSEREGFNISALEACELGVPTFVRLVCFNHPNLYKLTSANMKEILEWLSQESERSYNQSESFSWDQLAFQVERILASSD